MCRPNGGIIDGRRVLSPKTVRTMTSDQLGKDIRNNVAGTEAGRAGYGFGLGYFYDPWLWGFGPTSYYDPYYYGGYGSGGGYTRYREGEYRPVGSLRLKVEPREAQVYVDGYYVGEVDSFDGIFQKLTIEEGAHRVEIRAPGFETAQFEVMIIPGETVTYKGEMKRMQ